MSASDPVTPEPEVTPVVDAVPPKPKFVQPITALPDKKFFIKRMVIAGAMLAIALWFVRDGFFKYPEHNRKVAEVEHRRAAPENQKDDDLQAKLSKEAKELGPAHSDLNLLLQKIGAFPFTLVGLFLLVKFLRESKGALRLEDDVLHVPHHPPIPIASITGVENARWDKKGIAIFRYRLADGTTGSVRIDDFVFDRPPTDAIHDELIAKMPKGQEI